ncbi:hypothetical protein THAOC_16533 [Thalassiosira oceanica]|uniref:Uncharacterized protein n=1 Tax=Thalassiosira oceanica TaxID=159749 RepID=K0SBX9_THAOC|nr:hypothetical protein THAOC_16533 [Thalassiosira oceanica]|eukprot:EJK62840.1 hypothetical protein THAOC_16533 [Thalassiosira oceanica]
MASGSSSSTTAVADSGSCDSSQSPPMSFGETCAVELPSRCNVYLSESRPLPRLRDVGGGSCTATEGRLLRFATENHSVSLVKDQLSTSRLPSTTTDKSKKREVRTKTTPKQRFKQCSCLAHSHLVRRGSGCDDFTSVEVYALMGSPAEVIDAHSDNNTLTTGNHSAGSSKCTPNMHATYSLLVKCRQYNQERKGQQSNQAKPSRASGKSYREAISLQYRPLCVHACETAISTTSGDESAVAIFVSSVKDGKLHLYLANADSVQCRVRQDSTIPSDIPCFQEVDLGLGNTNDKGSNCSFWSASPITSLEACHSPNNTTYVAISCYDGTIRIVALFLSEDANEAKVVNVEIRSNSTFIVDGPALTLRFGCKDDGSLIVVAGSLYGYACLFYQVRSRKGEEQEFDGPLLIVDDLYDPQNNSEDSITSAHVARGSDGRLVIIVGTHRGRVLIFRQLQIVDKATQLLEKAAMELAELQNQSEHYRGVKSELECDIDAKKSRTSELNEICSRLRTKLDLMQVIPPTLAADEGDDAPSQMEIDEPVTEPVPSEDPQTGLGSPNMQTDEIETELVPIQNLEENEPDDEPKGLELLDSEPGAPHETDQAVLHAELDDVTEEMDWINEKLSECAAAIAELDDQAVEREKRIQRLESFPSRLREVYDLERSAHRYEILQEAQVPYPVQGITSSVTENGNMELFVTTTLTLHMFLAR